MTLLILPFLHNTLQSMSYLDVQVLGYSFIWKSYIIFLSLHKGTWNWKMPFSFDDFLPKGCEHVCRWLHFYQTMTSCDLEWPVKRPQLLCCSRNQSNECAPLFNNYHSWSFKTFPLFIQEPTEKSINFETFPFRYEIHES